MSKTAATPAPAKSARTPRSAAKPPVKAAAKPAAPAPAKTPRVPKKTPSAVAATAKPAAEPAPAAEAVAAKAPKQKLVRDSFTIPRNEYQVLDALKQHLVQLAKPAKKSELLRAGIKLLAALPDDALIAALAAVPSIKTGRPGKSKS